MKKSFLKRLGLNLLQHLLAVGILTAVAWLLLNSYMAVDSINGTVIYRIFPVDTEQEFEESEIYHDLFRNAVSDITQLVVIKGQLETDGVFDPQKKIDVTEYARKIGADQGCAVSVTYELDDIIKWGKYGVEYTNRIMSMSEFIEYFGNCLYPENFKLDEHGGLSFDSFYRVEDMAEEAVEENEGEQEGEEEEQENVSGKSEEELALLEEKLQEYTSEQLEELVFSYIVGADLDDVKLSREDDGSLSVYIPMLNCRYHTTDKEKQLTGYVNNWVDYIRLQTNVVETINSLTLSYQRYQVCNAAYGEGSSNVKYMVRMMTDSGVATYTNRSEL